MQINNVCFWVLIFISTFASAQSSIDNSFEVNNIDKQYSLYIPSDYNPNTPSPLLLGLHPLNPTRWNSASWRDTLINFAESNNLILVCPDGGPDGRIDDAIDTLFTSMLLDSVAQWYNVNTEEKYMIGFSWGAKTVYTYGLRRTDQFAGYIVIGAAINGSSEVQDVVHNAAEEKFYLIHGSLDNVAVRYTQLLDALKDNNACVESNLMAGVGHTIDFPNRNQILNTALDWIKSNDCQTTSTIQNSLKIADLNVFPNPSMGTFYFNKDLLGKVKSIRAFGITGTELPLSRSENKITFENNISGIVIINVITNDGMHLSESVIVCP